jgi:hypothetical protein
VVMPIICVTVSIMAVIATGGFGVIRAGESRTRTDYARSSATLRVALHGRVLGTSLGSALNEKDPRPRHLLERPRDH